MTRVYPSPKLPPTEYVPGVGADGADLPNDEAEALLASGVVVKTKPKAPADPAETEEQP
jgi:hypothetical protein